MHQHQHFLAKNVHDRRMALGWSKVLLAWRAHLTLNTVKRVEQPAGSRGKPEFSTIAKLARALGTTTIALLADPAKRANTEVSYV